MARGLQRMSKGIRGTVVGKIELLAGNFNGPRVCWLAGLAGAGKTTITQTIGDRTSADGKLDTSFPCSRDFEDRSNPRSIFPTPAVQFARRYTEFRSFFAPSIRSYPEITRGFLCDRAHSLVAQPLGESNISTVIIIDALREYKNNELASATLSVLGQPTLEVRGVKPLVTGRPEPRTQEISASLCWQVPRMCLFALRSFKGSIHLLVCPPLPIMPDPVAQSA